MSTSIHEISWRIKSINKRRNNERRFTAAISGCELKDEIEDKTEAIDEIDFDKARSIMEESHRRRMNGNG